MIRSGLAALILLAAPAFLPAQTPVAPATNAPPAAPAPVSDVVPDAEILERSQAILDKYPPPTPGPDAVETSIREDMRTTEPELQTLTDETARSLAQNPSLERIALLEKWASYFSTVVGTKSGSTGGWLQAVTKRHDEFQKQVEAIDKERQTWIDTAAALKPDTESGYIQQVTAVQTRLDLVRRDVTSKQKSLLQLQLRVTDNGRLVNTLLSQLETARSRAISQLFQLNAPPVWSMQRLPEATDSTNLSWSRQLHTLQLYSKSEPARFLFHGLLLAVLIGGFWWLRGYARKLVGKEPGIAPAARIFETPIATGLLLGLGASPLIYYPIAPRLLSATLGAVALIPCVLLLRRLIEQRLFPILYALVIFYFLEEFRSVAAFHVASGRAYLLFETLCAISFLSWVRLALQKGTSSERFSESITRGAAVALAILAAGWLAEVLGFTLLANLICVSVQRAATLALALYAVIRILDALLFIGMRLRPLSSLGMVREYGPDLQRRAARALTWLAGATWVVVVFEQFPWANDVNSRVFGFFARYDQNNLVLRAPGKIALALLIGWGVFQVSRLVRFTLATDLYPRFKLGAGIPYAISMLLHYVLLTIAFIAATAVLGIDMTKFTILVSALGVGVGFGLQNIINNFVSGLILLFERPVKIGDTILTGTDSGTVERIGIRASVLRTPSGTEVIVPNGTLISSNVTNWTLSSRERIILIPLNVPRGQDTTHLTEILTKAAASHSKVLQSPGPQVVAQTLGANLGLELRAWTRAADDWTNVRSEIVLAVNAALARENITLA